jgi:hypothetical protein
MYKGSNSGTTSSVSISDSSSVLWIANDVASTSVSFSAGSWSATIYGIASTGLPPESTTIAMGVWSGSGFTGHGSATLSEGSATSISCEAFSVPSGQWLAISITDSGSNGLVNPSIECGNPGTPPLNLDATDQSIVSSPLSDPGYPVPELSTLVLMGSGLVVGVGMLAYSNKKKK